jgi:hypothetical protein
MVRGGKVWICWLADEMLQPPGHSGSIRETNYSIYPIQYFPDGILALAILNLLLGPCNSHQVDYALRVGNHVEERADS